VSLWAQFGAPPAAKEPLAEGAAILRAYVEKDAAALLEAVGQVVALAPFRHMITPGGYRMSVSMTNCGPLGWVSNPRGYRYDPVDPLSDKTWPPMPEIFQRLAASAAAEVGFANYRPEACLINRYEPGAKLSLHQDRDENDRIAPIVSVSLGLPAVFLWGGLKRADRPRRIRLESGDVVVWGGPSRFIYHGVAPLAEGEHPLTGPCRINLTFRKVL
jgi:alkylated DNA repair protein (DNA oxidative demethylase)